MWSALRVKYLLPTAHGPWMQSLCLNRMLNLHQRQPVSRYHLSQTTTYTSVVDDYIVQVQLYSPGQGNEVDTVDPIRQKYPSGHGLSAYS